MRSSISTASALVAALLFGAALAGPHPRHQQFHNKKRDVVTLTDDSFTTVTITDIVTIDWPPAPSTSAPAPPTSTPAATTEPAKAAVLLEKPSTSSPAPVVSTPTPSPSPVSSATKAPILNLDVNVASVPSVAPTTLATVLKPSTTPAAVPTSTSTPPAASSSAAPVSSSSGGLKRGVPYNDASLVLPFLGSGSQITWSYNWGNAPSGLTSGIEFVAMLWGLADEFTSGWSAAASSAIASGSTALLYCNEPDLAAQSNLSPQDAATGYMTYMQPFAGKAKLGMCATTNGGAPMGLSWTESFLEACTDCQIDFCPFHFYDSATNIDYFKSYVQDAYKACGNRPIWFTEVGVTGSDEEITEWIQEVIPFVESLGYVDRIAYFMAGSGSLISGTSLSSYGETWATFTS